jgi:hypothetical protein
MPATMYLYCNDVYIRESTCRELLSDRIHDLREPFEIRITTKEAMTEQDVANFNAVLGDINKVFGTALRGEIKQQGNGFTPKYDVLMVSHDQSKYFYHAWWWSAFVQRGFARDSRNRQFTTMRDFLVGIQLQDDTCSYEQLAVVSCRAWKHLTEHFDAWNHTGSLGDGPCSYFYRYFMRERWKQWDSYFSDPIMANIDRTTLL